MLINYLKTFIWRIKNNQVTVVGSLSSLVIGTVCITLLISYLKNELSTDRFHQHADEIYLTMVQVRPYDKISSLHIKRFFNFNPETYPGVEKATTVLRYGKDRMVLKSEEANFTGVGLVVDSNFLEVFDFPMLLGDPLALNDHNAIVLTEEFALRNFGNLDVLNKTIEWVGNKTKTYTVGGVLATVPANSSLQFDFLVPHHSMYFQGSGGCFLLVNEHFDTKKFESEISKRGKEYWEDSQTTIAPLKALYFNEQGWELNAVISKQGNKNTLYIIMVIATLVLIISMLNLTNLWALRAINDQKEILVRKVNGAKRGDLIKYQFAKVTPILLIAIVLSCFFYAYTLPAFNNLLGAAIPFTWQDALLIISGVIIFISLLSQVYPVLLITQPVLEDSIAHQFRFSKNSYSRKIIISLQYTFTIILLISAIVVSRQLNLMLQKDLGFDYVDVVKTKLIFEQPYEFLNVSQEERLAIWKKRKAEHQMVKDQLQSSPYIVDFTQGISPFEAWSVFHFKPIGGASGEFQAVHLLPVSFRYEEVFGLTLVEGHFFDREGLGRSNRQILINESARSLWNIEDIGQTMIVQEGLPGEDLEIIGVIRDFNYEHLSTVPQPLILQPRYDLENEFFIKLQPNQRAEGLAFLRKLFKELNPSQSFAYTFMEEEVRSLYRNERKLANIYIVLTIIAFFLSSIGLFVVALHEVQKRTKEIGIRKVNGAKIAQIVTILNQDFIQWVLLAFVVACPVAYYSMSKWLENFAYKTVLSWWIFATAGVVTLGVGLLTVSWQSWRAANRNPVEVLKYE